MLIAIWPILAAIAGILIYVLATHAKLAEIGRALMWSGFVVTLLAVAGHTVRIG